MRVQKTKRERRNRIGIEIKYIISLDRPLRFGSSDSATENKERKKKDNRTKKSLGLPVLNDSVRTMAR